MVRPGWTPRWDTWTPPQRSRLAELAGQVEAADLAAMLSAEFGIPRTLPAVRIQAKRQRLSLERRGYSQRQIEWLFGVDHRAVMRWWITPGHLQAERCRARGPHAGWHVSHAALEAFVRDETWAYDWRRMQPGHPMTMLAEVAHKAEPWVTLDVACRWIGINRSNLLKWRRRGVVSTRQRPYPGAPRGRVMVRARDLPRIRDDVRSAQRVAHQRTIDLFTARRRAARRAA